jgi:hypothetical protein
LRYLRISESLLRIKERQDLLKGYLDPYLQNQPMSIGWIT